MLRGGLSRLQGGMHEGKQRAWVDESDGSECRRPGFQPALIPRPTITRRHWQLVGRRGGASPAHRTPVSHVVNGLTHRRRDAARQQRLDGEQQLAAGAADALRLWQLKARGQQEALCKG